MLKAIIVLAVSVYFTSTLYTLWFWAHSVIAVYREEKKILTLPLKHFLYIHFCPIVHTKFAFNLMHTFARKLAERGM